MIIAQFEASCNYRICAPYISPVWPCSIQACKTGEKYDQRGFYFLPQFLPIFFTRFAAFKPAKRVKNMISDFFTCRMQLVPGISICDEWGSLWFKASCKCDIAALVLCICTFWQLSCSEIFGLGQEHHLGFLLLCVFDYPVQISIVLINVLSVYYFQPQCIATHSAVAQIPLMEITQDVLNNFSDVDIVH